MNKETFKNKRPTELQIKQRYSQQYHRYINTEFTYNSHVLLKKLGEVGEKEPHMMSVPVYRITLQIVKIMMMNELEILFLGSTLQEMKWKIVEPCLNDYSEEVTDITPFLEKDNYARKVQLALLLISYIVKIYLNEEYSLIDFKIRELIKSGFDKLYQAWVQKVQSNFKFNPKSMNKLFKQMDKSNEGYHSSQIVDFNQLVNQFFKNSGEVEQNHVMAVEPVNNNDSFFKREEHQLPIEENEEDINRFSNRLQSRDSLLGTSFMRRQSNKSNEFFQPGEEQSNKYKLELIRDNSIKPEK